MSSGTVSIMALKNNDYYATEFPGTVTGLQAAIDYVAGTGGDIYVGPGTLACGSTALTISSATSRTIAIRGAGERATQLTYTGTGDLISNGANDSSHSGAANAYNGTGCQLRLIDIGLTGPGSGTAARGVVDWECGSSTYERVFFNTWGTGYYGIGADVSQFQTCLFNSCGTGAFLASRSDQNTFDSCYFTLCGIGALVEYAWGSRFKCCQFVFSTTADIIYDAPASPTDGGDERLDISSTIIGCWFESNSTPTLSRHIWVGRNGTSSRRVEGISIYGGYLLCSNTTNFVDLEAGNVLLLEGIYQGGTLSGSLCNIVTVSGLTQASIVRDCRINGGTFYAGNVATSQLLYRQRHTSSNAFAASFTPNALGGEIVEFGALTGNITINAPTNPNRGQFLMFRFVQDGTGGRTVTWNSVFKHKWQDAGNLASTRSTIRFYYDGTNWEQIGLQNPWTAGCFGPLTIGTSGAPITKVLTGTATLNFDLTAVVVQDLTITVTGAATSDVVLLGVDNASVSTTVQYTAWVSSANTVTVRATTAAVGENPASGTFRATVIQF